MARAHGRNEGPEADPDDAQRGGLVPYRVELRSSGSGVGVSDLRDLDRAINVAVEARVVGAERGDEFEHTVVSA